MTRRSRMLAAFRVLALAAVCCEPHPARSDGPVSTGSTSTRPAYSGPDPSFQRVTLTGPLIGHDGPRGDARLELVRHGSGLDGSIRFGDLPAFKLLDLQLTVLPPVRTVNEIATTLHYELSYTTDTCEHAKPGPAGARMTRWDPCFYTEDLPRPRRMGRGRARLNVRGAAGIVTVSAFGTNPWGRAYLLTGRAASGSRSEPLPASAPDRKLQDAKTPTGAQAPPFRGLSLHGAVVEQSGARYAALLELRRRGSELDGAIRFGNLPSYRLLDARLTLVRSTRPASDDPLFTGIYKLSYQTDTCEHTAPKPPGTQMVRWDPCFFIEGSHPPRVLQSGEAQLEVQRTGTLVTASAFGTNDVGTLRSAYDLLGREPP